MVNSLAMSPISAKGFWAWVAAYCLVMCKVTAFFTNNAYHVVMFANCTSGTTLDGFTVIAGQADDNTSVTVLSSSESPRTIFRVWGGGIVCALSHPTISNCVLIDNLAESGGGMLNTFVSHPTVVNTLIHQNYAVAGAGMYNHVSSNTVLRNTTITRNVASGAGGAMYNFDNSNPNIRACIIWGNIASGSGATLPGIANNSSTPVLSNSIVQDGFTPCVSCPNTNGNIDPQFVNLSDANGLDNILGNADDGFKPENHQPGNRKCGDAFRSYNRHSRADKAL